MRLTTVGSSMMTFLILGRQDWRDPADAADPPAPGRGHAPAASSASAVSARARSSSRVTVPCPRGWVMEHQLPASHRRYRLSTARPPVAILSISRAIRQSGSFLGWPPGHASLLDLDLVVTVRGKRRCSLHRRCRKPRRLLPHYPRSLRKSGGRNPFRRNRSGGTVR